MTATMAPVMQTDGGQYGKTPSPSEIAAVARPIARQYGIVELYLFGSMANGNAAPDSDIDLIYGTSDDVMSVRRVVNFRNALREAFGRDIDLVPVSYITQPESKPYNELIRSLFVRNVSTKPILRILPEECEEKD